MKKRTKQLVCSALVGMVSISSVSAMYLTPQAQNPTVKWITNGTTLTDMVT